MDVDNKGRLVTMRTLALDPPIFEIEDFLSDKDCARVQDLAAKEGYFRANAQLRYCAHLLQVVEK